MNPNAGRGLTPAGAHLIKHFESCKQKTAGGFKAYVCPAGVLSIGWGHTTIRGRKFTRSTVWTQAVCDQVFMEDMDFFVGQVRRLVKVELTAYQFDAVASFCMNCGQGNLGSSTLLKKINARDFDGAAKEFPKWNKGGGKVLSGLVRRRASESLLFQNIPDEDYDGKPDAIIRPMRVAMPHAVDLPRAA